jgi:hypothetical protein
MLKDLDCLSHNKRSVTCCIVTSAQPWIWRQASKQKNIKLDGKGLEFYKTDSDDDDDEGIYFL